MKNEVSHTLFFTLSHVKYIPTYTKQNTLIRSEARFTEKEGSNKHAPDRAVVDSLSMPLSGCSSAV